MEVKIMQMALNKKNTWLDYIEKMGSRDFEQRNSELTGVAQLLSPHQQFHHFLQHSIPMIYAIDYSTGKYTLTTEGSRAVMGYKANDFLEGGIGFTLEKYHPEDLKLFNEEIFPDRLQILKTIPPEEHNQYIFSFTYRIKDNYGKYINILQRNCFIHSDRDSNPLISMGLVINVNNHSASNPVTQCVEKISNTITEASFLFHKKNYYLRKEDQVLSKREIEILKWSAEGLTYKEIAARLFIADGTVLQHRKNMLQKSNTKNVAELIAYAIRNQLL